MLLLLMVSMLNVSITLVLFRAVSFWSTLPQSVPSKTPVWPWMQTVILLSSGREPESVTLILAAYSCNVMIPLAPNRVEKP